MSKSLILHLFYFPTHTKLDTKNRQLLNKLKTERRANKQNGRIDFRTFSSFSAFSFFLSFFKRYFFCRVRRSVCQDGRDGPKNYFLKISFAFFSAVQNNSPPSRPSRVPALHASGGRQSVGEVVRREGRVRHLLVRDRLRVPVPNDQMGLCWCMLLQYLRKEWKFES